MKKQPWTEIIDEYAEGIYWEPQYLGLGSTAKKERKSLERTKKILSKVRNWEYTLNIKFNIMYQLLSQKERIKFLRNLFSWDFDEDVAIVSSSDFFYDMSFCHPDAVLQSTNVNMFLELKTKSSTYLFLQQLFKYVLAHQYWENKERSSTKSIYLGFITPKKLELQWNAKERTLIFSSSSPITDLSNYIKSMSLDEIKSFLKESHRLLVTDKTKKIIDRLCLGSFTWDDVFEILSKNSNESTSSIVSDFILSLQQEGILK